MQSFFAFIIRHKNNLFFLLLLCISCVIFIQSRYYQKVRFTSSISWVSGTVYNTFHNVVVYFSLKKNNRLLVEENKRLREALYNREKEIPTDSLLLKQYYLVSAYVIKNSYSKPENYLTLNRGWLHEIHEDMGVISSNGIVGIVEASSKHFSLVQSILNRNSAINAKVKGTNHFGSLQWNDTGYECVQLADIPKLANIMVGDTIVTGGMSAIFPEGIPIGVIKSFQLKNSQNYFNIEVKLFNDMTSLEHVYILKNTQKKELINLQQYSENE